MASKDLTTQGPEHRRAQPGETPAAALTIACHPDMRRIGQRALLVDLEADREISLSRMSPDFISPGSMWGAPLEDPFLSRSPVTLRSAPKGGVEMDVSESSTRVLADGERVELSRTVARSELERGVVLELAARVVLVLHLLEPRDKSPVEIVQLIGESDGIELVRASIGRISDLEVPVLLRGESGTGKEIVAQAIHETGPRREGPFVAVNLGALSPALAAAELFGSVKGAFTGAVSAQRGYFRAAQGGTLFLDEVGEAPSEVQVMLLRALEAQEIFPVGSQQPRKVDVRLVAATDSDLEARVRAGNFKAPLLHRLSAYEVWLPPLRERRDDIGRLLLHFAAHELAEVGEDPEAKMSRDAWLPADLAARLVRYPWPGNVRQLRNVVRQLVIDGRGQEQLRGGARVERFLSDAPDSKKSQNSASRRVSGRRPAELEFAELESALEACNYNLASTARRLGVSRPSLYNLIRRHPTLRTIDEIAKEEISEAVTAADGDVALAARRLRVSALALRRRLARIDHE